MTWVRMPYDYGWWFFTPALEDWDLSKPIHVSRHVYGGDPKVYWMMPNEK